ncbi:beta-N-acetylhexosaminidase [Cellulosimicrobium protaetiae]|uniref:beta-N-acetylhexosaminidase n=1 Tax=Cellulosimicrobium protaetiae TaxID=2587808 RepID=A0A6M5UFX5_9MICO|nr:family 20 glycosylhydrolase [Cellulosimicrobium protaetiae]QJW37446.1 family 20 glycosylhydrolase [Cellulosimicrobium protaetiae]
MRRTLGVLTVVVAGGVAVLAGCTPTPGAAPSGQGLGLVPLPASVEVSGGEPFVLDDGTRVVVDVSAGSAVGQDGAVRVGELLADELRTPTGLGLAVETTRDDGGTEGSTEGDAVVLRIDAGGESWEPHGLLDDPADEAYILEVTEDAVVVSGTTPAGLYRGTRTLLQLLPPEVESPAPADGVAWEVPAVEIADEPRYAYRGAMLDVARRFFPVEDVKRFVDHLADYRLNVLHLHLTDDQGWRFPVDGLPELTDVGGRTQEGWPPGTGGPWSYTPQEYAEIVAYAAERYVTVVPEVDGPGHTLAAQSAIGSLRCDGTPGEPYWGPEVNNPIVCSSDENMPAVRGYLETVLAAVVAQNPGPYVHVGGDEAPDPEEGWYENYAAAANEIVAGHGRTVVGWHQWAQGTTLPAGSLVQYWGVGEHNRPLVGTERETEDVREVRAALAAGADLVMSPADRTYLDMKYDDLTPYGLEWAGRIDLERAYDWDPETELTSTLDPERQVDVAGRVAGVEAPLWSDRSYPDSLTHLPTSTDEFVEPVVYLDHMTFPRLPALAEVAWTAQADRDYAAFEARLVPHAARWDAAGIGWNRVHDVRWDD